MVRRARLAAQDEITTKELAELGELNNILDNNTMIDWNNIDLTDGYEQNLNLIDSLTFEELLTAINCNLPDITAETVQAQFETILRKTVREARGVFAANLGNIVAHAIKERQSR